MCEINKDHPEAAWISIILRIAMASLFGVAAISKFIGGIGQTVTHFETMFKTTWLPLLLVTPYAYSIAFIELFIALWLLSGIKLRAAWIFTAFVLITLAFGIAVAGQGTIASANYIYVAIACFGLYFSRFDCCAIGPKANS